MNLMIVDDSPAMRKMIIRDLSEIRKSTNDIYYEAEDGIEALNLLNNNPIDIVFLDWNMPRLDGLSFVHNIRDNNQMKELIIIMITHENKQDKIMEAIKAGVDAYIVKPFTVDMLWKKLNEFAKS
jgi:two-component system, chemotaxis family, chemotaxis protein CheY